MNICMIVLKNYSSDARVRRYAESLADTGINVDILCLKGLPASPQDQREHIKIYPIPLSQLIDAKKSYGLTYLVSLFLFSVWLLALYLHKRYSIVHVHNMPDLLVFAAVIPRILGAKVILDIHDPMPEFYQSKFARSADALAVKLLQLQEKLSITLAHAVITANGNFKANLIARGIPAEKIAVVNNVADARWFYRNPDKPKREQTKERFTLIYPGTIAPRYGLDVAIRALPLLVSKIPIHVRIIGVHSPYVHELKALAVQLGVAPVVEILPHVPVHEVPQQIAQADVGIYPALPDAHMSIATPTKVLEYAAMGVPVVASRLKILDDLFGTSAIEFFAPGNVEQFAHAILELYHNPARRQELVRNADNVYVHLHSWAHERQVYFDTLNGLLGAPDNSPEKIVYPSV